MILEIILIILAVLGLADASYLAFKHTRKQSLTCPTNGDCHAVVDSSWSKIGFIRNETLGLVYYLAILLLGCSLIFLSQYQLLIIKAITVMTGIGFVYSLYLTYLQKYVIKTYCFYCLMSALISTLLFINSLFILF